MRTADKWPGSIAQTRVAKFKGKARKVRLWAALPLIAVLSGCSPGGDSAGTDTDGGRTSQERVGEADSAVAGAESVRDEPASTAVDEDLAAAKSATPAAAQNANDLIEALQTLSWEQSDAVDASAARLLQRLRQQGADAVVPIRDFLLSRNEANPHSPELRRALLDVLLSLRLPEVEDIAVELLAGRPSAFEAWQLGQYLESIEPGKYTDAIRVELERALIETTPAAALPGELFLFLGSLGNEETALVLAGLPMQEEAYGRLALASIPDGGGIPLLEQDARVFESGGDTVTGRLALQLLAQQAPQHPAAAAVLLDLATKGVIPSDLWPYLLDIVAGHWELTLIEPAAADLMGSHTYYHPEGDQVIYRAALHPDLIQDGYQSERLVLLEQLQPLVPEDLRLDEDG